MSTALCAYHGRFGRVALYHLNRPMTTHAHREGHLLFALDGVLSRVPIDGRDHLLGGDVALGINPWDPHAFIPGDPERGSAFLILYINPAWFLELSRSAVAAMRFGRSEIAVTPSVRNAVGKVATLLAQQADADLFYGYLYELVRECFDQSWQWRPDGAAPTPSRRGFSDYRVRRSIRLMSDNPSADIRLDDVAREAGLSRPHFYKLFRLQTGVTPQIYLNTLLMERAISLITTSDHSVTDIGYGLGFPSQSGFTRFFSTNVGMAPTDYRRVAQFVSA